MINNKKRYDYLIEAHNFHYSQFNIWMAFFIVINGGLLAAYCSDGLNSNNEKMCILILGYVASFLFHCCSKSYNFTLANATKLIYDHEEKNVRYDHYRVYSCLIEKNNHYFHPLKGANIKIAKVVTLFSFILTYAWGILLLSNIFRNIKILYSLQYYKIKEIVITIVFITIINIFFLWLVKIFLRSKNTSNHFILKSKPITRK